MNPRTNSTSVEDVIAVLRRSLPPDIGELRPETKLLAGEVDLDSLQLLELVEGLRAAYGVDFLAEEGLFRELCTPNTIVAALRARRPAISAT